MAYPISVSKETGKKYLDVDEATKLQKTFEQMMKRRGLKVKTLFHPRYIEVPTYEDPKEKN